MNSIRERTIQEIIRRIKAGEFTSVNWSKVIRTEIPESYDSSDGAILAVLEGRESYEVSANRCIKNRLDLFLSFAVPLADAEEPATAMNNVAGEILKALAGQHTLHEGGDGIALGCMLYATATDPDLSDRQGECAAGTVEFTLEYRTAIHDPFRLP